MAEKFYTTQEILSDKRAEVWREFISSTFVELDCEGLSRKSFFGELRARQIGELGISAVTNDASDVYRTKALISKSGCDDFLVSVQTKGSAVIRQLGREAVLNPGDFTIYDSTVPYHLHFANRLSQIVVRIPRVLMNEHFSMPEALTALPIRGDSGIAQITANFAEKVFNESLSLTEENQKQVARTFLDLLETSLRQGAVAAERLPKSKAAQLLRIKKFIDERLKDPGLTPAQIAAAHSISVRYLQMLFEKEGISPSKFIWNQRLERAKRDLISPNLNHKSITEICFVWGFSDTAHFARAIKSKFGASPRALRQAASRIR